jgi:5-methyltetrahydrofolate--homocysteine methyltransferase
MLQELKRAIIEGDDELALELAKKAIEDGIQPLEIMNQAMVAGIHEVGELWKKNVYFLPDVVMSTESFQLVMEFLEPHLSRSELALSGKVVIGTVAGDMHNLGKKIVVAMLRCGGFQVVDLGENVSMSTFIDQVKSFKPDILGLGCYMTTTMPEMRHIIRNLADNGFRDNTKVIIGGVPTSQEFADEIGADAWGKDAIDAVEKAKKLVS